jgi:hypothetical protein
VRWLDVLGSSRGWDAGGAIVDSNALSRRGTPLNNRVYPAACGESLSYGYVFQHEAAVDDRPSRAEVRLAAYLIPLFASSTTGSPRCPGVSREITDADRRDGAAARRR